MTMVLTYAGRHEEAVRYAEQSVRVNPIPASYSFLVLGMAYSWVGRYEEAIAALKKAVQGAPDHRLRRLYLTVAFSWAGRLEEARAQADEVLRISPNFSLKRIAKRVPFKNQGDRKRYFDGLRKAGLPETPPLPLPDKPSIAVLPFVNMSGDPEQEYFSDGITESIITGLSKTPKLFVIARNSTFTYKDKPTKVQKVGRELGVRYVLEGSVQKSRDRVRITVQLVDAKTGHHLWAERYDRELKDVFALQDEITMKIMRAMQLKLTEGEVARRGEGTQNLEAYTKLLQALEAVGRRTREDNVLARRLAEEAIALDPEYPRPYVLLALTHLADIWLKSSKSPKESLAQSIKLAQKAIVLDESLGRAHGLLGYLYSMARQHDKAIAECEKAVALEPNSAGVHYYLGWVLRFAGRHEEAVLISEKAIRLDPFPPPTFLTSLAHAYCNTGRYEEAIEAAQKAVKIEPDDLYSHLALAFAYNIAGREDEARTEAAEILRINPKYSLQYLERTLPYKNQADRDHLINALRKAGLK
jgi:adenylate cyclase